MLVPALVLAVGILERDKAKGADVAVCVEEGAWSGRIWQELEKLSEEGVVKFCPCTDEWEVERRVVKAEADCGFVVRANIGEQMMDREWHNAITVYETSSSSITGIAREQVSGVLFKLYSEQNYEDYMRVVAEETANETGEGTEENIGEAAGEETAKSGTEEFVDFAKNAYEKHLTDGSTFAVRYVGGDGLVGGNPYVQESVGMNGGMTAGDNISAGGNMPVFPLKGVLAVVIFVSGMCGMLEYGRDMQEKRFDRIASKRLTYAVNVWLPTIFVSLAALMCLWVSDGIRHYGGMAADSFGSVWTIGMWVRQTVNLVTYQGIIVLYCGILGLILRRQEAVAAAIPILSIGSLVCAPVFIRLAAFFPVFKVLEKLFPVTYYLLL